MNKNIVITLGAIATMLSIRVYGNLLLYESFDGYTGTTLGNNNGGIGWSASWAGWNEGGAAEHSLDTGTSLDQGASPFTPVGGHAYSIYDSSAAVSTRIMSNPLDTDSRVDYYISFLIRRDAGFGETGLSFYNSGGNPSTSDLFVGGLYDSDGGPNSSELALNKGGVQGRTENGFTNGVTYFMVVKLAMNETGTDDNIYANLYQAGDTVDASEPVSWQFANLAESGFTSSSLDTIYLRNATSGQEQYFDELRIGTSWNAVAVPEPSTILLMLVAFGSAVVIDRFRR